MEDWIAWSLNSVGDNDPTLIEECTRKKINKNSEESAFARTLRSRNHIDTIR